MPVTVARRQTAGEGERRERRNSRRGDRMFPRKGFCVFENIIQCLAVECIREVIEPGGGTTGVLSGLALHFEFCRGRTGGIGQRMDAIGGLVLAQRRCIAQLLAGLAGQLTGLIFQIVDKASGLLRGGIRLGVYGIGGL